MDGIWMWLLVGSAGLLAIAVAVACIEQIGRTVRPPEAFASALPRAVSVDVEIEAPLAAAADEARRRREALDVALVRMAQPATTGQCGGWDVTTPMVGPGPRDVAQAAQQVAAPPTPA